MNDPHYEKWVNLFKERIKKPSVEILQQIEVGYLSTVYLISVNGNNYAVKMYHPRYNGTQVLQIEQKHIKRARTSIPEATPQVVFSSPYTNNEFHREILVMKQAFGIPLTKDVFNEQVVEELVNILQRLHSSNVNCHTAIDEIERLNNCKNLILQFLKENEIISQERFCTHIDALGAYYLEKKEIFNQTTVIHGDLWWDNILVDNGRIKIVDWLESSKQDYCRDLAQFKIGTLNEVLNINESLRFFEKIVNAYVEEFKDETIIQRITYYLPLMYLEESFYLPFKFFPWEIKYKENDEHFRERFIDYYKKSECAFKLRQENLP